MYSASVWSFIIKVNNQSDLRVVGASECASTFGV